MREKAPPVLNIEPIAHDQPPLDPTSIQRLAIEAARLLDDRHCEDVVVFDVRQLSQLTDYILIASGSSDRQMKSVGLELGKLFSEYGLKPYGSECDPSIQWFVLDLVEVMIHLFEPSTRSHYDLEMLWGDAPTISWHK